jgi:uroporphyrinogen-III decarboxylase
MRVEQWRAFKRAAKREGVARPPLALIVDSPWIPGYLGISHLDYFLDPEVWFDANLRLLQEFPEVTFFPSWWVEYGMAIEPSSLGAKIVFHSHQTPSVSPTLSRLSDVQSIRPVQATSDGLMAFVLRLYERQLPRIRDAGFTVPVVSARGPLCTAAFYRGLNDFMTDLTDDPAGVHALVDLTTRLTIDWLRAQANVIGESVEGLLILDDIVGFLSPSLYREFAHPYLCRIFGAFPKDWVKVYHNDANVAPLVEDLATTGIDVLNWGKSPDAAELQRRVGDRICLMGNVPPLEIGVRGTPDQVKQAAREVLQATRGQGLILSLGGGVSPGMPRENIRALIAAAAEPLAGA